MHQSPLPALLPPPMGTIRTFRSPTVRGFIIRDPFADDGRMIRNYTVLHFAKRFFESAFVHDFSRATVPFSYVLRK
jgi:hypothetical protein